MPSFGRSVLAIKDSLGNTMSNTEQRIVDLEMKVAFQEDTIDSLSSEVALLNELIDRQRTQLEYLANKIGEMAQAPMGSQLPEPPPPHY